VISVSLILKLITIPDQFPHVFGTNRLYISSRDRIIDFINSPLTNTIRGIVKMDKTTVSVTFIIGGFFLLIVSIFVLSFFVPSLRFAPPKSHTDSDYNVVVPDPGEQPAGVEESSHLIHSSTQNNNQKQVREVRVCSEKIKTVRSGPGSDNPVSASNNLKKGQEIYIVGEQNGWVQFRTTPDDRGTYGWIKKNMSDARKQISLPAYNSAMTKWMRSGLLLKIIPESNAAVVNTAVWATLDRETRQIVAQAIATYFAIQNKNDAMWCHITDGNSGKKIATYTDQGGLTESP